jgi:hypothetical protein
MQLGNTQKDAMQKVISHIVTCKRNLANSFSEFDMMTSSSVSEVPRQSNWNWSRLAARPRLARERVREASITSPTSRAMPLIRAEV